MATLTSKITSVLDCDRAPIVSPPTDPYRCVVRNTVGTEFFVGEIDATTADEALEKITDHIVVAKKETTKWFVRWLDDKSEAERGEFKKSIIDTLLLHKNMADKGYAFPELYKPLELPSIRVKVFYPGTSTCAHNLAQHIGFEELGLK